MAPSTTRLTSLYVVAVVQMFGPEAPPLPWDEGGAYKRGAIELYFCANVGTVLKEEQLVQSLQGQYPDNYVELGAQV